MENVYPENYFADRVNKLLGSGSVERSDICSKLDISKGYLSGILSGKKKPPSDKVNMLLDQMFPDGGTPASPATDDHLLTLIFKEWPNLSEERRKALAALALAPEE